MMPISHMQPVCQRGCRTTRFVPGASSPDSRIAICAGARCARRLFVAARRLGAAVSIRHLGPRVSQRR